MKKFLLMLIAVWVAISAHAVDYYLIGGFNNWGLKQANCKFTDQGNGTFVLDYNGTLTSGFKINDGTWSNDAANFGGSATLQLGVTYNLTTGGSSGNIPLSANITNPHLVFNPTAKTLLITGQEKEAVLIYGIHGDIFGDSNWSTINMTESSGKWVLSNKTINAGSFGIKAMDKDSGAQTSWISADGTPTVTVGSTMKCKVEGTNFVIAAGTYTFTFDPNAMTLVVTGTSTGETPEVDEYANWWVNLGGEFNGNNFFDGGVQPVDKIATFTNQAIGNKGFKVKTWNGSVDQYYISDGETNIPTEEWVQFAIDAFDAQSYIKDAPADGVYTVKYNVETNQIFVSLSSGGGDYPENIYVIGDYAGGGWDPTKGILMTNEGDGLYTAENVTINNTNNGLGYFALTSALGDWTTLNDNRMGPAVQDTPAVIGDEGTPVDGKGDLSWSIPAGTYDMEFEYNDKMLYITKVGDVGEPEMTIPAALYILGDVNGTSWSTTQGIEAKNAEGVFTWKGVEVDDSDAGYGYLSLVTKLGDSWDVVNGGDRFGATAKDAELTSTADIKFFPVNVSASSANSWKVAAGEYDIVADLNTMKIAISKVVIPEPIPGNPEYISIAQTNSMMVVPTPAADNVKLYPVPTEPNIYEGKVVIKKSWNMAFYTGTPDDYVLYTGTPAENTTFIAISLSQGIEWPIAGNEEQEMTSHLIESDKVKMYVSQFPQDYPTSVKELEVAIRIDWENKTFSIVAPEFVLEAPESLYLWGTLGGFTDSARYTVMGTMNQTAAGSHIYELTMDVPECGPFEIDGEFTPLEGDPNYGFYYVLTNSNESISKGTQFQVPIDNHLIDIPNAGDKFTSNLLTNKSGCNMICLTPGQVKMTYNFNTNTYTVEMIKPLNEPEPEEPAVVTFNFVGVENAYNYISVFDMNNMEMVEVNGPSINFDYDDNAMLTFAMSAEDAEEGYSFEITADGAAGDNTYMIGDGISMDGSLQKVLNLFPGADGFVFTITVTKEDTNAVDSIFAGEGIVTVYNVNGMVVLRNADKAAVKALAPGLYIANGKKIIVK